MPKQLEIGRAEVWESNSGLLFRLSGELFGLPKTAAKIGIKDGTHIRILVEEDLIATMKVARRRKG